jgi:outer membrane immunogenic protein
MKRYLFASAAITALIVTPALAADMPLKAAPPPPAWTWTGCYIGGNAGAGWTNQNQNRIDVISLAGVVSPSPVPYGSETDSGVVGGGQVGCDYQFGGGFVIGIQGQFDWGDLRGSHPSGFPFGGFNMNDTTRSFQTLTGRLGYAFTPGLLAYAKGGAAWVQNSDTLIGVGPPSFLSESASWTASGYTVGGGLEWRLAPTWSVFAEYNYMNFGTKSVTFIAPAGLTGAGEIIGVGQNVQTAVVGMNWRLNWMAP